MAERRVEGAAVWGALLVTASACAAGCGTAAAGGGEGGRAGTTGAGAAGDTTAVGGALAGPCPAEARVGGFAVQLVAATDSHAAYAQASGRVRDGVDPREIWQELAADGDCRLVVIPTLTCADACAGTAICAGEDRCVAAPVSRSAGVVELAGVGDPLALTALAGNQYYGDLSGRPYPPAPPGAPITLTASGGDFAPFSLAGRGIAPLDFPGASAPVARARPLPLAWTAPAEAGAARILVTLDLAHHGSIAARIQCDVADTGATEISAALVDRLLDQGVAGVSTLTLNRRTVDSTALPAGCVELQISSAVEQPVTVDGVTSCTVDADCPPPQRCRPDLTCG